VFKKIKIQIEKQTRLGVPVTSLYLMYNYVELQFCTYSK